MTAIRHPRSAIRYPPSAVRWPDGSRIRHAGFQWERRQAARGGKDDWEP